jgi:hypothetical protein
MLVVTWSLLNDFGKIDRRQQIQGLAQRQWTGIA